MTDGESPGHFPVRLRFTSLQSTGFSSGEREETSLPNSSRNHPTMQNKPDSASEVIPRYHENRAACTEHCSTTCSSLPSERQLAHRLIDEWWNSGHSRCFVRSSFQKGSLSEWSSRTGLLKRSNPSVEAVVSPFQKPFGCWNSFLSMRVVHGFPVYDSYS